ncbi:RNA polymerase II subunit A [Sesbania bispinosa]|nr:RNA polymerase II subunit A [Sesbania bispinosa]
MMIHFALSLGLIHLNWKPVQFGSDKFMNCTEPWTPLPAAVPIHPYSRLINHWDLKERQEFDTWTSCEAVVDPGDEAVNLFSAIGKSGKKLRPNKGEAAPWSQKEQQIQGWQLMPLTTGTELESANLHKRDHVLMKTVLVVNLEVKDNHEEAAVGARLTFDLCQEIEAAESWEESIDDIIAGFEKQNRRKLLYSVSFY